TLIGALGDERVNLFVLALPVAAVDEDERRPRRPFGRIPVEPLARCRAIAQIVLRAGMRGSHLGAAALPVDEIGIALGEPDRGAVVVRIVERRAIHAAIEGHESLNLCASPLAPRSRERGLSRRYSLASIRPRGRPPKMWKCRCITSWFAL